MSRPALPTFRPALQALEDRSVPAATVADAGFELSPLTAGKYAYAPAGGAWQFDGQAGVAADRSGFTSRNPRAPEGTRVAFLQNNGGFTQTLALGAGTYRVGFASAQRADHQASSQTVQVLIDGAVVATVAPQGKAYAAYSTPAFTVGAGSHTLAFRGTNPNGGDNTALVDNVAVASAAGPAFALPATAAAATVTGRTQVLSAGGIDLAGGEGLTYTWANLTPRPGVPAPTLSANGTSAARATTVTFYGVEDAARGDPYTFRVTARNAAGQSVTSDVSFRVVRTLKSVRVGPAAAAVPPGGSWTFAAAGADQFGREWVGPLPAAAWALSGPGTLTPSATGAAATFTAAGSGATGATVRVASGKYTATAAVDIGYPPLAFDRPAAAVTFGGAAALVGTRDGLPVYFTTRSSVGLVAAYAAARTGDPSRTVTWSTVETPAGAGPVTFGATGTHAAATSSIAATTPGLYRVRATLRDALGREAASEFWLDVNPAPTVTGVTVASVAGAVGAGAGVQLYASATDQFGVPLPAREYATVLGYPVVPSYQPSVAWSATAGSITAGGFYTGPPGGGAVTVTATAAGRTASYSLFVSPPAAAPAWGDLQDPALSSLAPSLGADGALSRADVLALLESVATHPGVAGTVTAAQVADLRLLAANGRVFGVDEVSRSLLAGVVASDPADALYQGSIPLGPLTTGTPPADLRRLVGKWFLGLDHPALPDPALDGYRYVPGAPWGAAGPVAADVRQSPGVSDCYLLASVAGLAARHPQYVRDMFTDNRDGTWTVRLFRTDLVGRTGTPVPAHVTVDRYLPARTGAVSAGSALWVGLLEKALIQLNGTGTLYAATAPGVNSYGGVDRGYGGPALEALTGRPATAAIIGLNYGLFTEPNLRAALAGGSPIVVNTVGSAASKAANLLIGHYYAVVAYDSMTKLYSLYNPYGSYTEVSWATLVQSVVGFESVPAP